MTTLMMIWFVCYGDTGGVTHGDPANFNVLHHHGQASWSPSHQPRLGGGGDDDGQTDRDPGDRTVPMIDTRSPLSPQMAWEAAQDDCPVTQLQILAEK